MPHMTGTVEVVSVKPLASPDTYGNTHRVSFKLGEDWFSAGSSRGGAYINKNVPNLTQGSQVEFMYDINGDFKNVKRPTLSVTGSAGGSPSPAAHAPSSSPAPQSVSSAVGMGVGMAINNAINMACNQLIGATDEDIERKACEIYRMAERLKANAAKGNIAADLEEVQHPPNNDFPDEDIPF